MRPVVSYISSRTYFLAEYLDQWFKSRVSLDNLLSVINSVSLVNNIQKVVTPEEAVLISFDVIALFPNIPKQTTIGHARHLLLQSHVSPEEASDFIDLLNLCWSSKTCLFREKFYSFPETVGILIGSPLGSLISEIFCSPPSSLKFSCTILTPTLSPLPFSTTFITGIDTSMTSFAYGQDPSRSSKNFSPTSIVSTPLTFTMENGGLASTFLICTFP